MRWRTSFIPTIKEEPSDAEVVSHRLLVRAGMIRQVSRGVYDFLPLALRTLRKIEAIVREEMNRAGAQELLMPVTSPAELWQDSGRWEVYGKELLRFKDRHERDFCLAPTHEEVITDIVRRDVRSYRELPMNLYQIQTKFRDEVRPRFGLMRGREFIMKDAYSFHLDRKDAEREYRNMYDTYRRIFTRCGLQFRAVEADSGAIGGSLSHEFQVLAESGEDALAACGACDYAANVQKAESCLQTPENGGASDAAPETVPTPGLKTVPEVSEFLKVPPERFIKTMIYRKPAGGLVAVLVRGDHEVNETKLGNLMDTIAVEMADEDEVLEAVGAPPGFLGPMNLPLEVWADHAIRGMTGAVTGANQADAHTIHVDQSRDFTPARFEDLRLVKAGDPCARCDEGVIEEYRGIEVGHVFYLGRKYSEAMNATILDSEGHERVMEMGCYGIGVTRLMAAAIEQNNDADGIIWPMSIAPFSVELLPLNYKEDPIREVTDRIYQGLTEAGHEVLLDDRDERPGVKFKDADLVGVPLRVTIGAKGLAKGNVELRWRGDGTTIDVPVDEAVERIGAALEDGRP
ncbi:MAG: proline--tRNA ligase [Deltaproteobacteria bacterium]|nr:proline--tRNA ligase [Deltaproteobacteria bacterium]